MDVKSSDRASQLLAELSYLTKMTGFTEESRVYMGREFPEEMMLMVGFGSRDLDWFLAA